MCLSQVTCVGAGLWVANTTIKPIKAEKTEAAQSVRKHAPGTAASARPNAGSGGGGLFVLRVGLVSLGDQILSSFYQTNTPSFARRKQCCDSVPYSRSLGQK